MFCSVELGARIDRGEADLLEASLAARRALGANVGPAFVREVGGGIACWVRPDAPFNKVAALGFAPLEDSELDALEADYAARGAGVRIELSSLGDAELPRRLAARGYRPAGIENVLGQPLPAAPVGDDRRSDVEVAPSPSDELDSWIDVVYRGFATPDGQGVPNDESFPREVLEPCIREIAEVPGASRYVARRAGQLAAAASMRVHDGVVLLTGAATLPEHRRHGAQTALLHRRLADAAAAGAELATMVTQPGSTSMANALREGFALLYVRNVWEKPVSV